MQSSNASGKPMESANGEHGSHGTSATIPINGTSHPSTANTTSHASNNGSPLTSMPVSSMEIETLMSDALNNKNVLSPEAEEWYKSMTTEELNTFEQGLISMIHKGCMIAAKRSFTTVMMQKRTTTKQGRKRKRKDASKGTREKRATDDRYYGRDVNYYGADAAGPVGNFGPDQYYGAVPYDDFNRYDDRNENRSWNRHNIRDREYYDGRHRRPSPRSRERWQERYDDAPRRRSRSGSRSRRQRRRRRSHSRSPDDSRRSTSRRSRSLSVTRRENEDFESREGPSPSGSIHSQKSPLRGYRRERDFKHEKHDEKYRKPTDETAPTYIASTKPDELMGLATLDPLNDDASASRRSRRSRMEREKRSRSDRYRSHSPQYRRSSSPRSHRDAQERRPSAVERKYDDDVRQKRGYRCSSSRSESRPRSSKDDIKFQGNPEPRHSRHRSSRRNRNRRSHSPGESNGHDEKNGRSSRRRKRKDVQKVQEDKPKNDHKDAVRPTPKI